MAEEIIDSVRGEIELKVDRAIAALAAVNLKLDSLGQHAEKSTKSLDFMSNKIKQVFTVAAITTFTKSVFEATNQMDELGETLEIISGSAQGGADGLAFVRREAERLGLSLPLVGEAYKNLAAAGKAVNQESAVTQKIFSAVAGAGQVLNLAAEDITEVLSGVEKAMLKGTITSRELTAGIGLKMPAALEAMAAAAGTSVEGLKDLADKGQLISSKILPAMAQQLETTFGGKVDASTKSAEAQFVRLGNAVTELQIAVGESGLIDWLAEVAKEAKTVVKILSNSRLDDFSKNVFTANDFLESQATKLRDAAFELATYEKAIKHIPKELIPHYEKEIVKTQAKIKEFQENIGELQAKIKTTSSTSTVAIFELQSQFDSWNKSLVTSADVTKLFEMQMAVLDARFRSGAISAEMFAAQAIKAADSLNSSLGRDTEGETGEPKENPNAEFFAQQDEKAVALATYLMTEEEMIKASMERRLIELQNAAVVNEDVARQEAEIELQIRQETADRLAEIEAEKLQTVISNYRSQMSAAQNFASALFTFTGASAKKQHKIQKTFAVANALVSAYESVVHAYNAGAKINPYVGAAFAAVAAITQAAAVSKVAGVEPGSGGAVGASGGGGSPSVSGGGGGGFEEQPLPGSQGATNISGQRNVANQNLTVVLQGRNFSDDQVVQIMEQAAALSDNGRIKVNVQRSF